MSIDRRTWWRKGREAHNQLCDFIFHYNNEISTDELVEIGIDTRDYILEQLWAIREGLTDQ